MSDPRDLVRPSDPNFAYICGVLREFQSYGFDANDEQVVRNAIATAAHRRRVDDLGEARAGCENRRGPVPYPMQARSVVYYMRVGTRCKIGFTTNLAARIAVFNPEELLATEPGGCLREGERHIQFERLRTTGEWFRYEDELVEHVTRLQNAKAA